MPAGTAKKNDPITDAERLTLYKDQLDNIRDLKANQWSISRYGVGAQAAILAVASIIDISDYSDFVTGGIVVILILLVLIAAVGSLSVNHMFQYYITKRREALNVLSSRPADTFDYVRESLRTERRTPPKKDRWSGEPHVLAPILAVQVVAAALAIWVVIHPILVSNSASTKVVIGSSHAGTMVDGSSVADRHHIHLQLMPRQTIWHSH
jgi:hypothetical protein